MYEMMQIMDMRYHHVWNDANHGHRFWI